MKPSALFIAVTVAALAMLASLTPQVSAQSDQLTATGYAALGRCESENRPTVNTGNGYYGEVQWLPATWRAAATDAGYPEYASLTPDLVQAWIQQNVTVYWWANSRPSSQWPNCYDDALRAMGVPAPCVGRNVVPCSNAPVPTFAGLLRGL